jgi:hypothetical protein
VAETRKGDGKRTMGEVLFVGSQGGTERACLFVLDGGLRGRIRWFGHGSAVRLLICAGARDIRKTSLLLQIFFD